MSAGVHTVPYRMPDGSTARIRFDAGDHAPFEITFTFAGGRVGFVQRIDPPLVLFWTGTEAVRS